MIRCKRCFKKYDGYDPECPRCGRLNEYDDDDGLENIEYVEHVASTSWFKNVKCEVCGKSSLSNANNCPSCFNSNIVSRSKKTSNVSDSRINNLVESCIRKSQGKVDMLELFHESESINLDINTWETPYAFEYGKTMTVKSILIMFATFVFFSLLGRYDSIREMLPMGSFILVVGLIMVIFKKKVCVTGIRISKLRSHDESVITYFKDKKGKRGEDVFKIWSYDLESIDLMVKDGDKLQSVRFVEKKNENGDQINHQVYPEEFSDTSDFIKVILFFCFKYNIDLYIKDEVVSKKLSEAIN